MNSTNYITSNLTSVECMLHKITEGKGCEKGS